MNDNRQKEEVCHKLRSLNQLRWINITRIMLLLIPRSENIGSNLPEKKSNRERTNSFSRAVPSMAMIWRIGFKRSKNFRNGGNIGCSYRYSRARLSPQVNRLKDRFGVAITAVVSEHLLHYN
jgi:hypothetical protein